MSKTRCWSFTYFPNDLERDKHYFIQHTKHKAVKNCFIGVEMCPSTEKIHFQGYIRFHNAKDFKSAKRWFAMDKIHIEPAQGNDRHNYDYCLAVGKYAGKEGHIEKLINIGTPAEQGKRTDIERAVDIVKDKRSMSAVLDEVPNYQACRHAELYLKYNETPRPVGKINVIWIYGASETGKTKHVYDNCSAPFRPLNYKWWEGYDGHKTVLIDDFRKDYCKYHELLTLLDIYPFRVETKGGSRQVQFDTIYITSPYSPQETYDTREDIYQLTRRITQVIHKEVL